MFTWPKPQKASPYLLHLDETNCELLEVKANDRDNTLQRW